MASPLVEAKLNSGAYASTIGGIDASPGDTVTLHLIDSSAKSWSIACLTTDELSVAATVNASLAIDPYARTATFTAPTRGHTYRFSSIVDGGVAPNGTANTTQQATFCVYVKTTEGRRVLAADETFEGDVTFGWLHPINDMLRNPAAVDLSSVQPSGVCTPKQFGAVEDGVTNDNAAFVAAMTAIAAGTYSCLELGAKTYLVTGFTPPSNCAIRGRGKFASILKTTTNAAIITANGVDGLEITGVGFLGSSAGSAQHGIYLGVDGVASSGPTKAIVRDVHGENLGGRLLSYSNNPFTSSGYMGPIVTGLSARGCGYGIYSAERGEYLTVIGFDIDKCTNGIYLASGNANISDGVFTACTTVGIDLQPGTNDSHGVFSSVRCNHNAINVRVGAIQLGHLFQGCHFYGSLTTTGQILLTSSKAVNFRGCEIDVPVLSFDGSTGTVFDSNLWPAGIASPTINDSYNSHASTTTWKDNVSISGGTPSFLIGRQFMFDISGTSMFFGGDSSFSNQFSVFRIYAANSGYFGVGSTSVAYWDVNQFGFFKPITGGAAAPYGVHGIATQAMSDANQTPSASVYQYGAIRTTGAITADRNLVLPTVSSDTAATVFDIVNDCTGNFGIVVKMSSGTTVRVPNGKRAHVRATGTGVENITTGVNDVSGANQGFRLTATTGVSVTSSDVASTTAIYLTPHDHGAIDLWDGTSFITRISGEVSLTLPTLVSGKTYDVFAYWSGSAVTLELSAAWSSDSARTDSIVKTTSGVSLKSSDLTRRHVGWITATSTTQTCDTAALRYMGNVNNKRPRLCKMTTPTGTWNYTTAGWRAANATPTSSKFSYVNGDAQHELDVTATSAGQSPTTAVGFACGVGIDTQTAPSSDITHGGVTQVANIPVWTMARYFGQPGLGRHDVYWLEYGGTSMVMIGDASVGTRVQTGMFGTVWM